MQLVFRLPHLKYWYFTFGLFKAGSKLTLHTAFGGYDFYVSFHLRYSSFYSFLEVYLWNLFVLLNLLQFGFCCLQTDVPLSFLFFSWTLLDPEA